jgi:hypothetical protein
LKSDQERAMQHLQTGLDGRGGFAVRDLYPSPSSTALSGCSLCEPIAWRTIYGAVAKSMRMWANFSTEAAFSRMRRKAPSLQDGEDVNGEFLRTP